MKEEIRALMNEALADAMLPMHDQLIELNARLSAQRFLLEITYGTQYEFAPASFEELMEKMIMTTRSNASRASPMPDDDAIELQARIATHLARFQNAVQARISAASKS